MTLEQRAFDVLKEAHDLIKGESSFKTAQTVTVCEGEYWDAIGMDEKYVEGDPENEDRPYIYISFDQPKAMGRDEVRKLDDIDALEDRDLIMVDGKTISFTLIGEPL